jgi:flagellar basal body P-ring formation protein FlgA
MRAILLAAVVAASPASAATLRSFTDLETQFVHVSDLFDEAGANANRVLGPGPAPGGRIIVETAQLAAIARQFGVDWRPASSADRIVLERPGRPLPREQAMTAVRAALVAAGASPECDIDLGGFAPPLIPYTGTSEPVVTQLDYDGGSGHFTAVLSITGSNIEPINSRVSGRADDVTEVVVAAAHLLPGTVVRPDDLRVARVHTALVHGEVARTLAQAVGQALRRQVAPGQPVPLADLTTPAAVQKGANVLITLESPGIALAAQGQALESGSVGDRIRVLNTGSRAVVLADILGPGQVRVAPGAMPLSMPGRIAQVAVR